MLNRAGANANAARDTDDRRDRDGGTGSAHDRISINEIGNEVENEPENAPENADGHEIRRKDGNDDNSTSMVGRDLEGSGWARKRRAGDCEESEDQVEESQPRRVSKKWKPAINHTVSENVQRQDR